MANLAQCAPASGPNPGIAIGGSMTLAIVVTIFAWASAFPGDPRRSRCLRSAGTRRRCASPSPPLPAAIYLADHAGPSLAGLSTRLWRFGVGGFVLRGALYGRSSTMGELTVSAGAASFIINVKPDPDRSRSQPRCPQRTLLRRLPVARYVRSPSPASGIIALGEGEGLSFDAGALAHPWRCLRATSASTRSRKSRSSRATIRCRSAAWNMVIGALIAQRRFLPSRSGSSGSRAMPGRRCSPRSISALCRA